MGSVVTGMCRKTISDLSKDYSFEFGLQLSAQDRWTGRQVGQITGILLYCETFMSFGSL